MKKILFALVLILLFIPIVFLGSKENKQFPGYPVRTAIMNGHTLHLIVANTEQRKIIGLSGSAPLKDTEGMLFTFPNLGRYGFWMKDMKYALDFIYVRDRNVVEITKNVTPDTYPRIFVPNSEFNSMIEVTAGVADKIGVHVGDNIVYNEK